MELSTGKLNASRLKRLAIVAKGFCDPSSLLAQKASNYATSFCMSAKVTHLMVIWFDGRHGRGAHASYGQDSTGPPML